MRESHTEPNLAQRVNGARRMSGRLLRRADLCHGLLLGRRHGVLRRGHTRGGGGGCGLRLLFRRHGLRLRPCRLQSGPPPPLPCVSKRHELSVREHERWQGECGRAGAPYSIELVESSSTCEFGSRAGDPPALHRAPSTCEQQTGTASEAKRSTQTNDSPPSSCECCCRVVLCGTPDLNVIAGARWSRRRSPSSLGVRTYAEGTCTAARSAALAKFCPRGWQPQAFSRQFCSCDLGTGGVPH